MNNKIAISILLSIIFIISCKKQNKNNSNPITSKAIIIDLSDFKGLAKNQNSVVESVQFFQLETNEKSLFGNVGKVLATNEYIFILDIRNTNSVLSFDHSGKYLGKIGSEGNGPEEYIFLGDIDLDLENNLCLLDLRKSKVLKFHTDGTFINEQRFGFMTYKFAVLDEDSYIFDQGTRDNTRLKNNVDLNYKLITWNPNLESINKFLEYTDIYDSPHYPLPNPHSIYRSGNKLNYLKPYERIIYRPVSEDEIISSYHIDFGKYNIPKSFYSNYSDINEAINILLDLKKMDYASNIINIFETSKYLSFNFSFGSDFYWAAVSKRDNSVYVRNVSKMALKDYPFLLCPNAVINDQFITILKSEYIPYLIEKYGEDKLKEAGLSLIAEHKENMNPILVKWSLKDLFE